eukprot:g2661.t1
MTIAHALIWHNSRDSKTGALCANVGSIGSEIKTILGGGRTYNKIWKEKWGGMKQYIRKAGKEYFEMRGQDVVLLKRGREKEFRKEIQVARQKSHDPKHSSSNYYRSSHAGHKNRSTASSSSSSSSSSTSSAFKHHAQEHGDGEEGQAADMEKMAISLAGKWFHFDDARVYSIGLHELEKAFRGEACAYVVLYRNSSLNAASSSKTGDLLSQSKLPPEFWAQTVLAENIVLQNQREEYERALKSIKINLCTPATHQICESTGCYLEQCEPDSHPREVWLSDDPSILDLKQYVLENFSKELILDAESHEEGKQITIEDIELFLVVDAGPEGCIHLQTMIGTAAAWAGKDETPNLITPKMSWASRAQSSSGTGEHLDEKKLKDSDYGVQHGARIFARAGARLRLGKSGALGPYLAGESNFPVKIHARILDQAETEDQRLLSLWVHPSMSCANLLQVLRKESRLQDISALRMGGSSPRMEITQDCEKNVRELGFCTEKGMQIVLRKHTPAANTEHDGDVGWEDAISVSLRNIEVTFFESLAASEPPRHLGKLVLPDSITASEAKAAACSRFADKFREAALSDDGSCRLRYMNSQCDGMEAIVAQESAMLEKICGDSSNRPRVNLAIEKGPQLQADEIEIRYAVVTGNAKTRNGGGGRRGLEQRIIIDGKSSIKDLRSAIFERLELSGSDSEHRLRKTNFLEEDGELFEDLSEPVCKQLRNFDLIVLEEGQLLEKGTASLRIWLMDLRLEEEEGKDLVESDALDPLEDLIQRRKSTIIKMRDEENPLTIKESATLDELKEVILSFAEVVDYASNSMGIARELLTRNHIRVRNVSTGSLLPTKIHTAGNRAIGKCGIRKEHTLAVEVLPFPESLSKHAIVMWLDFRHEDENARARWPLPQIVLDAGPSPKLRQLKEHIVEVHNNTRKEWIDIDVLRVAKFIPKHFEWEEMLQLASTSSSSSSSSSSKADSGGKGRRRRNKRGGHANLSHIRSRYNLRHGALLAYSASDDITWQRPCDDIAKAIKDSRKGSHGASASLPGSDSISLYKSSARSETVLRLFDALDLEDDDDAEP